MRVAVFADVHANARALDAVLEALEREQPDASLCLGDVVGYNAEPAEVVARLRTRERLVVVGGNHDRDVFHEPAPGTSTSARVVSTWTRGQLDEAALAWLSSLPTKHVTEHLVGVHGSYLHPSHVSGYVTDTMLEPNLRAVLERGYPRLAFCGHTHVPMLGALRGGEGVTIALRPHHEVSFGSRATDVVLINPGSVGQPRDGDPRASYAVVDLEARSVRLERVRYDTAAAAAAVRGAGLPEALAARLEEGR